MLPERVAMTRPSSGVKPIVVSTERPPAIAASDAPAPRWQVTIRSSSSGRPDQLRGPARGVGVGQAVEAVPAQRPALAPLGRERVGRGGGRHAGVEGGVEAGHGRHVRAARHSPPRAPRATSAGGAGRGRSAPGGSPRPRRRGGPGPCSGSRRGRSGGRPRRSPRSPRRQRRSPRRRPRRAGAGRSAVATTASAASRTRSLRLLDPALTTRILALGLPPRPSPAPPAPATSSRGSPARPRPRGGCRRGTPARRSTIRWRRWPARAASPGTRSMTSITRWNRSRSLSMTMSNGVVVVPSSL